MIMRWIVRDKSFYRSLIALAVPICFQNALTYGVALADNVMVGQLGETALGGLYVGTVVHMVLMNILFGVTQGALILTAQYWGARKLEPLRDIAAMALRAAALVGGAFAAAALLAPESIARLVSDKPEVAAVGASYLRTVGASYLLFALSQTLLTTLRTVEVVVIGLVNAAVALVLNIALNWLFIYGHAGCPAMGVRGAAFATVIARAVELALVAGYAFVADRTLGFRPRDLARRNPATWSRRSCATSSATARRLCWGSSCGPSTNSGAGSSSAAWRRRALPPRASRTRWTDWSGCCRSASPSPAAS